MATKKSGATTTRSTAKKTTTPRQRKPVNDAPRVEKAYDIEVDAILLPGGKGELTGVATMSQLKAIEHIDVPLLIENGVLVDRKRVIEV